MADICGKAFVGLGELALVAEVAQVARRQTPGGPLDHVQLAVWNLGLDGLFPFLRFDAERRQVVARVGGLEPDQLFAIDGDNLLRHFRSAHPMVDMDGIDHGQAGHHDALICGALVHILPQCGEGFEAAEAEIVGLGGDGGNDDLLVREFGSAQTVQKVFRRQDVEIEIAFRQVEIEEMFPPIDVGIGQKKALDVLAAYLAISRGNHLGQHAEHARAGLVVVAANGIETGADGPAEGNFPALRAGFFFPAGGGTAEIGMVLVHKARFRIAVEKALPAAQIGIGRMPVAPGGALLVREVCVSQRHRVKSADSPARSV